MFAALDFFSMTFSVSGITINVLLPPLIAFFISFFTSMGGLSGAFILLPFQMSVLQYTAPSVSGTNQFFNIIATPGGIYRYIREKRMVWSLAWTVILGTLPGVILGVWIRLSYLPDPGRFKLFAGCVLILVGTKLALDVFGRSKKIPGKDGKEGQLFFITQDHFSLRQAGFHFNGQDYSFSVPGVLILCSLVGIIGGIYGIGGGAIIAPFLVTFYHLPVYIVAGAALLGTFVTSVAGVIFYQSLASYYPELSVAPDWFLGLLFGVGGMLGTYLGARMQKYVSDIFIKLMICGCVFFIGGKYFLNYFWA